MPKELKCLAQKVMFKKLSEVVKIEVWTYSDASFNIVSRRSYAQTEIITGQLLTDSK